MIDSNNLTQQISDVEKWPKQIGKADYLRHLRGERLTRDEAIKARCYDCVCGEDTEPCLVWLCPLQPYCQWNKQRSSHHYSDSTEIPRRDRTAHHSILVNENGAEDK